jgi:MFS family permease
MTSTPSSVDAPPDKRFRRQRLVSTIAAAMFIMILSSQFGFGFIMVPGAEHFGVSIGQYLIWYSIFTLSTAIAYTPTGKLMAVVGVRAVAMVAAVVVSLSFLAMAFAPNIGVYYALSVPLGLAWAGCTILAGNTLVIGWHQHVRRGTVVGLVASSAGISGLVLGIIFPPIVAASGFQGGLFTLSAIVAILGVFPALFLVRNPPRVGPRESKGATPKRGLPLGLGLAVGMVGAAALVFSLEGSFTSIQPAAYASMGVPATLAGLLVSYYSIAAMLAKPLLGWMYDKLGLKSLYVMLAILFALGLPGMALFNLLGLGTWIFFVLIPIAAISFSVTTVVLPLIVGRMVPPERFSVSFGVVMTGMWLGLAVATPLWGVAFDLTGSYHIAMYLGGLAGLLGLMLCILATTRAARGRAQADTAHAEPSAAVLESAAAPVKG